MVMLIYAFQHNITKRIYVGCTGNLERIKTHFSSAKRLKHTIPLVNSDCKDYGFDFTAYMLEVISCKHPGDAYDAEKKWMHHFNTGDPKFGYNYLDKKARKHSIDSFPIYTEDEWRRRLFEMTHSLRAKAMLAIMKEMRAMKETDLGFQSLSEKSGISVDRLEEIFKDNRNGKELEIISLVNAFGIRL